MWAMRQRILGSHAPPCHKRMVITTLSSMFCLAALAPFRCQLMWAMWGGGGAVRRVGWGGVQVGGGVPVGRFGVWWGGGGAQAPLTSPCPPSNHTITINLTLTFAASWFGHAMLAIY